MLSKQQRFKNSFSTISVNQIPSIETKKQFLKALCKVKAIIEKLNQEIKELDQLQVYNDLLIKEPFCQTIQTMLSV